MANVKGVILNGTKYELLDAEARQLAGDAINQVETLENTVAAVETDVAAVKTDLASVAETATEAKAAATEASTLATQAETRAQEAYELAEKASSYCTFLRLGTGIDSYKSYELTEADFIALFGKTEAQIQSGDNYLVEIYTSPQATENLISVCIVKGPINADSLETFNAGSINLIETGNKLKLLNITDFFTTPLIKVTKQL